jgi:hypothetical protein
VDNLRTKNAEYETNLRQVRNERDILKRDRDTLQAQIQELKTEIAASTQSPNSLTTCQRNLERVILDRDVCRRTEDVLRQQVRELRAKVSASAR